MSRLTQHFQPPLYWQQFEDLTEGIFRYTFDCPKPQKIGRPGQSQDGVDVFGLHRNEKIGIQCKRMDELDENNHPYPGGIITKKFLREAIKEAESFSPQLDIWILATTAKRDGKIQSYARILDDESRKNGGFGIQLWFWDDCITDLNRHHDLQRWYYDQVIHVRTTDDQDSLILEMLSEAFSRAAFRSPLYQESPTEFVQALKDTQCAINTGQLKDRETRRVIRQAVGGRNAVVDPEIRDLLRLADEQLQKLREAFQENMGGRILQSGWMLVIDPSLLPELEQFRKDAIGAVNKAVQKLNLPPI